jgi:hypothetical protein
MEQWEHMLVSAVAGGNAQFIAFPATAAVADAGQPSAGSTINVLNELGVQGWQLVSASPDADFRTGRYWLKRRIDEVSSDGSSAGQGWIPEG